MTIIDKLEGATDKKRTLRRTHIAALLKRNEAFATTEDRQHVMPIPFIGPLDTPEAAWVSVVVGTTSSRSPEYFDDRDRRFGGPRPAI